MNFELASKLSGSRFVILKGMLAKLERAIAQFMLDKHTNENGYTEINVPILVKDVFDRESGSFGLLLSMLGLGSLVGSLIAASLGKWKRGLLLVVGNIVAGAAVVLIASISSWYMVVAVMVVVGLSEAGRRALSQALIMERVKDDYQGRVISVYTMSFGLLPIGIIPAGFAVDLLGISYTIAILGLGMLAVSIFVFFAYRDLSELN